MPTLAKLICPGRSSGNREIFALAAVLAVIIGSASFFGLNNDVIGLYHDDGIYAVLGKSLSEGSAYRLTSLPINFPHTKYPFLYSYILSWVWHFEPHFPENIAFLKAVNVGFLTVIFFLSYIFWRRRVEGREAEGLFFAFLICINPAVFSFVDFTVSDILHLLLALCVLNMSHEPAQGRLHWLNIVMLAVLVGLACLTRSAALPLAIAGAVHVYKTGRRGNVALYAVTAAAVISPWAFWLASHSQPLENPLVRYYGSYGSEPPAFVTIWSDPLGAFQVVVGNLTYAFRSLDSIFQTKLVPGLIVPVLILMTLGIVIFFRAETALLRWYVVIYLGLVLSWPFHPSRYLIQLVPVFYLFLFRGIHAVEFYTPQWVESKLLRQWVRHLSYATFALVVVLHVGWFYHYLLIRDVNTNRAWFGVRLPFGWDGFSETFEWIRKNTEPSAILASAYDPMYYLYTGRRAIRPGFHNPQSYFYPYGRAVANVGSAEEIKPELKRLGVRYLIIDPLEGFAERPAYRELFEQLLLSYETPPELLFVSADSKHKIYALPER